MLKFDLTFCPLSLCVVSAWCYAVITNNTRKCVRKIELNFVQLV